MIYDTLVSPFVEFTFMRRALVGTRAGGRVPDAPAHEPRRRCHGARDPAGCRDRLSRFWPLVIRDDGRRADCGLRDRSRRRRDRARDRAEGGCLARGVLPDFPRGRCHHRVAQRHQHRPVALPVRQRAGARRPDAAPDRRDHHAVACGACVDLPSARAGMRRSRLPAIRKPGRRARTYRVPRAGGDEPGRRLPCARHAARCRHHDAARRHRPLLGARRHRDDPDCRRGGGGLRLRGPAIILVAGVLYAFSVLFGRMGGVLRQVFPGRHLEA
jgi:hypothetical protein